MAGSDETGQPETNGPVSNKGDKDAWPTETVTRFHYDALDSLIGRTTSAGKEQRFYRNDELANEVSGTVGTTFVRAEGVVLAEHQTGGDLGPMLLVGDDKNSVLGELTQQGLNGIAYSPYGHRTDEALTSGHLGYNGERRERQTGWYLLGNGYRVFNPRLMRFHSPDNASPFGEGGLNAYMYCSGDPINRADPTGHGFFGSLLGFFGASGKLKDVPPSFLRGSKNIGGEVHNISAGHVEVLKDRMNFYRDFVSFEQADYVTRRLLGGPGADLTLSGYANRVKVYERVHEEYRYAIANKNTRGITAESLRDFQVVAQAYKREIMFVGEAKLQEYFNKNIIGAEEMKNIRGEVD